MSDTCFDLRTLPVPDTVFKLAKDKDARFGQYYARAVNRFVCTKRSIGTFPAGIGFLADGASFFGEAIPK